MEALLILLSTASGVALKSIWDSYIKKKQAQEFESWKIRVNTLENRLSQFYWPIYLRLQRDNVIWKRIHGRSSEDNEIRDLAYQVEEGVLLPNHDEIEKIIYQNIHLAKLDKELERRILAYLRHIDIYRSLRKSGIRDKDPITFGEPFPSGFAFSVARRLIKYQKEYDLLLTNQAKVLGK